ncbi:MarR family transcriptional regulator [Frankia sp. CNm7]|uniref:MarR family transcriptional regulator n=1 Tax=Frankia nepalensis TaxID=1836974 RepID=A0A937R9I0_9ACTN|nr:MarR family transcriptional regulator [Frankia nepalensis]MBL7501792.1 MarR family transcriptional regulator [Frankia nepalensis]MBL7513888.1 MarR family transcriptional regulator [Frankia nepalensis]MBL7523972.1 MarR family transcriptional regulator [Frankia nepalensis]MBL7626360.1 MarR family transcriptional regulator [Frankia nepalensis]
MIEAAPDTPRAAGAREAVAGEVWRAMLALTLGGEAHSRMHDVCQAVDLTPAALKILMVLSGGPRPMRELVEAFRHDPSYLTSVVDLLERRGVARREPHPTDRRAKTVVMTEEGQYVLARARELLAVPPASLRALAPREQEQLLGLLMRVVEAEPNIPPAMRPHPPAALFPTEPSAGPASSG